MSLALALTIPLRLLVASLGVSLVVATVLSAVKQFVLPRAVRDRLSRAVFLSVRSLFDLRLRRAVTYEDRDRVMAMYAPTALLSLPAVWLTLVMLGFTAIFWAVGVRPIMTAFRISGSSILTLGFAYAEDLPVTILEFIEGGIGLILVALLIAYLPTMYSAFSRREAMVNLLEVRAGSPPSAVEMLERFHRLGRMDDLRDLWISWEGWFVDIEETHTSLAALTFFRSPQSDRSWVTAAGTILDAASLYSSSLDLPRDPRAELCIRAGFLALRRIADYFQISYNEQPQASSTISIARQEFDEVCDRLAASGVPVKADRDDAWRHFAGWRTNYDAPLLKLATLTMAPYAMWSSDRSLPRRRWRK